MPPPGPIGGGPPSWQKAAPDPRARPNRIVRNRGVLRFRRLIGLHNVLAPWGGAGGTRVAFGRNQMGQ
jgi:hypothetical protein